MVSSTATTTLKVLSPSIIPTGGGFVYFEKEKGTLEKEETKEEAEKKEIGETFSKEKDEEKATEEATKILSVEKTEQKTEEPKEEKEIIPSPKKQKLEIRNQTQQFASFLLASLRETITTSPLILLLLILIFLLIFILIKEIKVLKRK